MMTTHTSPNPAFDGKCAFASVVKKGQPDLPMGNPNLKAVVNGQLYLFSNPIARILWKMFAAPSGKLMRWVLTLAVLALLGWGISMLLGSS